MRSALADLVHHMSDRLAAQRSCNATPVPLQAPMLVPSIRFAKCLLQLRAEGSLVLCRHL
jgi:hypothetical protein